MQGSPRFRQVTQPGETVMLNSRIMHTGRRKHFSWWFYLMIDLYSSTKKKTNWPINDIFTQYVKMKHKVFPWHVKLFWQKFKQHTDLTAIFYETSQEYIIRETTKNREQKKAVKRYEINQWASPPSENWSGLGTRMLTAFTSAGTLRFLLKTISDIPYTFSQHFPRKAASCFSCVPFLSAAVWKRWLNPTIEASTEPRNCTPDDPDGNW